MFYNPKTHFIHTDAKGGKSFRSFKREQKRQLKAEYGILSGRQWVKLRKVLGLSTR